MGLVMVLVMVLVMGLVMGLVVVALEGVATTGVVEGVRSRKQGRAKVLGVASDHPWRGRGHELHWGHTTALRMHSCHGMGRVLGRVDKDTLRPLEEHRCRGARHPPHRRGFGSHPCDHTCVGPRHLALHARACGWVAS